MDHSHGQELQRHRLFTSSASSSRSSGYRLAGSWCSPHSGAASQGHLLVSLSPPPTPSSPWNGLGSLLPGVPPEWVSGSKRKVPMWGVGVGGRKARCPTRQEARFPQESPCEPQKSRPFCARAHLTVVPCSWSRSGGPNAGYKERMCCAPFYPPPLL